MFTWKLVPFVVAIVFIAPIIIIFLSLFGSYSDSWNHLLEFVLLDYVSNSVILVIGVSLGVLFIGVITSYLVTNYNFYGKRFFEWALILPLAIPPYILAYAFTGLFDANGDANLLVRFLFNLENNFILFPSVRNITGAIIVFSFTLYPYVYLVTRSAFLNQSNSIKESGRLLGMGQLGIFSRISLPLARPAFIAGLMLVIMETLSDFGAVDHFAVQTFTTGIFRTWYGLYDLTTAMQLSSLLLLIIFLFYFLERFSREGVKYTNDNSTFKTSKELKLTGTKAGLAFFFCLMPIFVGFILPIIELIVWAFDARVTFFNDKFLVSSFNSISLGVLTGVLCAFLAFIINFSVRYTKNNLLTKLSPFLSIGYAIPGLILAVGITRFLVYVDQNLFFNLDFVITGSLIGLVLAYIIKSYALANSSIEPGYERISNSIDNSALLLGSKGGTLLGRIHFPLLKTSFLTAILLVTSEVVKELPATLILRPFNFDTLAVVTYTYAAEERMHQAAMPSLAIVLIGIIPLIFLSRMIRRSRFGET